MLRSLRVCTNIAARIKPRTSARYAFAKNAASTHELITSIRFQPLLAYKRQALLQHSFHTTAPFFEQQEKEEENTIDPKHKMLIGFTCKVCQDRSHHVMSKHSYTKGVVLIQCPGCKNRHLIADNLGWFRDSKTTVEDLVKEKGEAIRRVIVDDQGVERLGDLLEWLPEIAEEEKLKMAEAQQKAEELKAKKEG